VIHTQDNALVQEWEIENSPELGYVYLRSAKNRKLVLISPNMRGNDLGFQILLLELTDQNSDLAKWRIETVAHRYLHHPAAGNFPNHVFLMARIIPFKTGKGSKMKEHEMGVFHEIIDDNAQVVLWQHKGLYCAQPLNQMWIIEREI
jgi:hypothetical protein